MTGSLTIARVFGIPVRIEITWLIIFAILLIPGGVYHLPNRFPHWSAVEVWTVAGVYTLLFFASILLHELAHSLDGQATRDSCAEHHVCGCSVGVAHLTKGGGQAAYGGADIDSRAGGEHCRRGGAIRISLLSS